jgi:hypothetical protein
VAVEDIVAWGEIVETTVSQGKTCLVEDPNTRDMETSSVEVQEQLVALEPLKETVLKAWASNKVLEMEPLQERVLGEWAPNKVFAEEDCKMSQQAEEWIYPLNLPMI